MTRWPPLVWLMISVGSLFLLVGYDGHDFNPPAFVLGLLLIVGACAISFALAFGRFGDRPRPTGVAWLIPLTIVFYLLCAGAAMIAGGKYGIAAVLAGLIPLTAATLLTATARAKTVGSDRAPRDVSAVEDTDPYPGIGMDSETPLGDTPEHAAPDTAATVPTTRRPGRPHRAGRPGAT
jgi:hypothetical protein